MSTKNFNGICAIFIMLEFFSRTLSKSADTVSSHNAKLNQFYQFGHFVSQYQSSSTKFKIWRLRNF